MDIRQALADLDPLDDDQWTNDGDPLVSEIEKRVGKNVSRQEIVDAAPEFKRNNPVVPDSEQSEPEEDPQPEEEQDEEEIREAVSNLLEGDELLTESEFSVFLRDFPRQGLPTLEKVLKMQNDHALEAERTAEEMRRRSKIALSMTRSRIKREIPDVSNSQAIRSYIESQAQMRRDRTERSRKILQNVDLRDLDPRAQIDRSMSRNTRRGTKRPSR